MKFNIYKCHLRFEMPWTHIFWPSSTFENGNRVLHLKTYLIQIQINIYKWYYGFDVCVWTSQIWFIYFLFFYVTLSVKRPLATKGLISVLDVWFPKQSILDAIKIFYPQYWLQLDVEFTFFRQMEILKGFYCNPQSCEQFKDKKSTPMVSSIILAWDLNVQNELFKLTMKSNVVQAMAKVVAIVTN